MNSFTVPDGGRTDVGEATGVVIGVEAAVDDPSRHMNDDVVDGIDEGGGGLANFTDKRSVSLGRILPFKFSAAIAA